MKKVFLYFVIISAIISLTACDVDSTYTDNINITQKALNFKINGYNVDIPLNKNLEYFDIPTLNTESPAIFELLSNVNNTKVTVNGKEITPNTPLEINIPAIAFNEIITIEVSDRTDKRTVYIRTLNSSIPNINTAGESPNEGDYYISFTSEPLILKLNQKGEIIYYLYKKPAENKIASLINFKKHYINDKIYYSYFEQDPTSNLNFEGYYSGCQVILDEKYNQINKIYTPKNQSVQMDPAEGQDFIMLDEEHYIVLNQKIKLVDNIPAELNPNPQGSKVISNGFTEIKNGEIVFEWETCSHPELYSLSEAPFNDYKNSNTQVSDYAHLNSIIIDPSDNNFICSFRNLNSIIKVDRKTGNLIWILSGKGDQFGLNEEQKTSNQSHVRLNKEGNITIFDNGVKKQKSRILELKIDQQNKKVLEYKEHYVDNNFSGYGGSAQKLETANEVFVIGWGNNTSSHNFLTEIDFTLNKKLFEIEFTEKSNTYRCLKYK